MTFTFQYTEQGRRSPDPTSRLESCYAAVIKTAQYLAGLTSERDIWAELGKVVMAEAITRMISSLIARTES